MYTTLVWYMANKQLHILFKDPGKSLNLTQMHYIEGEINCMPISKRAKCNINEKQKTSKL